MASITEVSRSPAEPSGDATAKLAFKFNVVLAVLRTVSPFFPYRCARRTHQVLGVVFGSFIILLAVTFASEIGLLAVVALIVRESVQSVLLRTVEVLAVALGELRVLVVAFELESFQRLVLNIFVQDVNVAHLVLDRRVEPRLDPRVARGAAGELEGDPRARPAFLQGLQDAVVVVDVPAGQENAGRARQALNIANGAHLVALAPAGLFEALRAAQLLVGAEAEVRAGQELLARASEALLAVVVLAVVGRAFD